MSKSFPEQALEDFIVKMRQGKQIPDKGDPRFHKILNELKATHEKKSADYGTGEDFLANVRASAGWGISPWIGTMIRANDKVIRLQSLRSKGYLANEPARDALLDLASYAIIALVLMDEEENNGKV